MSSYKPGEWYAASADNCEERGVPIFEVNKAGLPYYIGWAAYMGTADRAPALANARLMAAAPKLLEALETMLDYYSCPDCGMGTCVACRAAQDARAVIRKAKGEED